MGVEQACEDRDGEEPTDPHRPLLDDGPENTTRRLAREVVRVVVISRVHPALPTPGPRAFFCGHPAATPRTNRAGTPAHTSPAGMSRVTTEPIPTSAPAPTER